jgi:predicted small metal-binding protein
VVFAGTAVDRYARSLQGQRKGFRAVSTGKTRLHCPCGEYLQGDDEDELVAKAQQHLQERHPHLEYDREDILFMAY